METVTTNKLVQDMRTVVVDAEDLLKATAGQTGERIEKIRAKAEGSLRSARYRLRRTSWRGIRGRLDGSSWTYGWIYLGTTVLFFFLLAFGGIFGMWIMPIRAVWLRKPLINQSTFGGQPVRSLERRVGGDDVQEPHGGAVTRVEGAARVEHALGIGETDLAVQ